ncbi:MAG: T9SS type A sorting domain-containing protein [Melioribacteraceae bacterium]|nr:T9SS type A sorting domain-containing protein [Melioribacteraceae bacterium]
MTITRQIVFISLLFLSTCLLFGQNKDSHQKSSTSKWSTPINISNTPNDSENCSFVVGEDESIHIVWTERDYDASFHSKIFYSKSDDAMLWTDPLQLSDTLFNYSPEIALDSSGQPHIMWYTSPLGYTLYRYYDGKDWSPIDTIPDENSAMKFPKIGFDSSNRLHLFMLRPTNEETYLGHMIRENGEWSPQFLLSQIHQKAGAADFLFDGNEIHLTYQMRHDTIVNHTIFYRHFDGKDWSGAFIVDYHNLNSNRPSIARDINNNLHISWRQQVVEFPPEANIFFTSYEDYEWIEPDVVSPLTSADKPSISFDSENQCHILWLVDYWSISSIYYAKGNYGNWSEPENITSLFPLEEVYDLRSTIKNDRLHLVVQNSEDYKGEIFYTYKDLVTSVENEQDHSLNYNLRFNGIYPNPVNSESTISFSLGKSSLVEISLYDITGRKVMTIIKRHFMKGTHSRKFDVSDLASGIYLVKISSKAEVQVKKIIVLK